MYDRLDHGRSMDAMRSRITRATLPFHLKSTDGRGVHSSIGLQLDQRGDDEDDEEDDDDVDEMMNGGGGRGLVREKRCV